MGRPVLAQRTALSFYKLSSRTGSYQTTKSVVLTQSVPHYQTTTSSVLVAWERSIPLAKDYQVLWTATTEAGVLPSESIITTETFANVTGLQSGFPGAKSPPPRRREFEGQDRNYSWRFEILCLILRSFASVEVYRTTAVLALARE
eukprot:3204510-Rhodomonas_salina.3